MIEKWRAVIGYEGIYAISSLGRIRRNGRIIRASINPHGYWQVGLCVGGKSVTRKVHRIVAMSFLGLPPKGRPWVNHIDGRKLNNCVENLEWSSPSENIQHGYDNGLQVVKRCRGEANGSAKLTEDSVRSIRARRRTGEPLKSIAVDYGIHFGTVSGICRRTRWAHVA